MYRRYSSVIVAMGMSRMSSLVLPDQMQEEVQGALEHVAA